MYKIQTVAYAEINNIIVALIGRVERKRNTKHQCEERFYVSIFADIKRLQNVKAEDLIKTKSLTYNVATKRYAKLCKKAQTMTFKTQNSVVSSQQ